MTQAHLLHGLKAFAPEAALTLLIMLVVVVDLFVKRDKRVVAGVALAGTLAILSWTVYAWRSFVPSPENAALFAGSVAYDPYSLFFKILFLSATAVIIVFAIPGVARWGSGHGEVWALMLSCTLGMCF